MIWVYLNKGSRNDCKTTKRKKARTFFFVSTSSQFEPKWLPLGRTPQRKGSSPNVSGNYPGVTKWFCCHFGRPRMVGALPATGGDGVNFLRAFLYLFKIFSQLNFLSNISTKKEAIRFSFSHKKNRTWESEASSHILSFKITDVLDQLWSAVLGANVTTFWPEDYGQIEGLGSWEVQRNTAKMVGWDGKMWLFFFNAGNSMVQNLDGFRV